MPNFSTHFQKPLPSTTTTTTTKTPTNTTTPQPTTTLISKTISSFFCTKKKSYFKSYNYTHPIPNLPSKLFNIYLQTIDNHIIGCYFAYSFNKQNSKWLLLIHGRATNRYSFTKNNASFVSKLLNLSYNVAIVDVRGFGDSSGKYDKSKVAIDIGRVVEYVGGEVVVVGYGFGASVALAYASNGNRWGSGTKAMNNKNGVDNKKLGGEKIEGDKIEGETTFDKKQLEEKLKEEKIEEEKIEGEKIEGETFDKNKLEGEKIEEQKLKGEKSDKNKLEENNEKNVQKKESDIIVKDIENNCFVSIDEDLQKNLITSSFNKTNSPISPVSEEKCFINDTIINSVCKTQSTNPLLTEEKSDQNKTVLSSNNFEIETKDISMSIDETTNKSTSNLETISNPDSLLINEPVPFINHKYILISPYITEKDILMKSYFFKAISKCASLDNHIEYIAHNNIENIMSIARDNIIIFHGTKDNEYPFKDGLRLADERGCKIYRSEVDDYKSILRNEEVIRKIDEFVKDK